MATILQAARSRIVEVGGRSVSIPLRRHRPATKNLEVKMAIEQSATASKNPFVSKFVIRGISTVRGVGLKKDANLT